MSKLFTDEQLEIARNVNLCDYFSSIGCIPIKKGNKFYVKSYPGLVLDNNTYYDFYSNEGGNAISCLTDYLGIDFVDAVKCLLGNDYVYTSSSPTHIKRAKPKRTFVFPKVSKDVRRAFAYLCKSRCIDTSLVKYLYDNKLLFQESDHKNIIFPWYDENNILVGADLEGTYSNSRFKQVMPGSKYGYGFNINFGHDHIYFFESVIDLLSFLCLYKHDVPVLSSMFVSLSGLKQEVIFNYINLYPGAEFFLCVDNDPIVFDKDKYVRHGIDLHILISKDVSIKGWYPVLKDFNEDLICLKRV